MRILFYSPDSYGLGHVRRSIALARTVLADIPDSSALLLTGAPRAHYFDYPERCDYLKLPAVTKNELGKYASRDLDLSLDEALQLRGRVIEETAIAYRARILMVDHAPRGLCGEVLPTLKRLGRSGRQTLRILGLRDVIDEPDAVREAWARDGVIDVLRSCYDHIVVYGQQDLFDPIEAYGIPGDVAAKITFVGYLPRAGRQIDPLELKRRFAPRTGKLVVVTLGGGGDGNVLLDKLLAGFERLGATPPFEVAAVTGPLMSPDKRERFREQARRIAGVTLLEYCHEMPDLIEAADFVVAMGGYNTICELACAGARALVVPRDFPRREQLLRAKLLARRGLLRYVVPAEAEPERLMREVLEGLERDDPPRGWGLCFEGLERSSRALRSCLFRSNRAQPPVAAAARKVAL